MPNGDPRDVFFYSILTLMIDSYITLLALLDVSEWGSFYAYLKSNKISYAGGYCITQVQ